MVSRKLVAATSVPLVLAVLAEGESWGYAILRRIEQLSRGAIEWNEGMLYPVLHRLESEGLASARWGASEDGRRRRYYRITPRGREILRGEREEWLAVHRTLQALWEGGHA